MQLYVNDCTSVRSKMCREGGCGSSGTNFPASGSLVPSSGRGNVVIIFIFLLYQSYDRKKSRYNFEILSLSVFSKNQFFSQNFSK